MINLKLILIKKDLLSEMVDETAFVCRLWMFLYVPGERILLERYGATVGKE